MQWFNIISKVFKKNIILQYWFKKEKENECSTPKSLLNYFYINEIFIEYDELWKY